MCIDKVCCFLEDLVRRGLNVYYDFFEVFREIGYKYLVKKIVENEDIFCKENVFK